MFGKKKKEKEKERVQTLALLQERIAALTTKVNALDAVLFCTREDYRKLCAKVAEMAKSQQLFFNSFSPTPERGKDFLAWMRRQGELIGELMEVAQTERQGLFKRVSDLELMVKRED